MLKAGSNLKAVWVLSLASLLTSHLGWGAVASQSSSPPTPMATAFIRAVRNQVARGMELPESAFNVQLENFSITPALAVTPTAPLQILGLGTAESRRLDGLFSVAVVAQTARGARELHATGILKIIGPVYVSRRELARGRRLEQDDLNLATLPWRSLPTGAAGLSWKTLVGNRVRAHIGLGEPVFAGLLEEPMAVNSGDMVELTLESGPGVLIRTRAVAKQEGRIGDLIRLEQPDTKKLLSGFVTGEKSVEVKL